MRPIYFDHAATTPVHPEVAAVMMAVYQNEFGNPSSIHSFGRSARKIVDEARANIAALIGAKPSEVIFTAGGTESDNLAIIGGALARKSAGRHLITTRIEHHAVLNTCKYLEETAGFEVTYLDVDEKGRVSPEDLSEAIREDTILISVMAGNNEVGTLQPVKEIAGIAHERGILFHTDAVQAFGLVDLNVSEWPVDLLSMTAHKINGPKGSGFLYVREGTPLEAHLHGGEQERKKRGGTHNVPGIAGLEKAVTLAYSERLERREKYEALKQQLLDGLEQGQVDFKVNGDAELSLPHIVNLYFPGVSVEPFLMNLDLGGLAVSSGSACTAGSMTPSHVLTGMFGEDADEAESSIRISFGMNNDEEQVAAAVRLIAEAAARLKK